MEKETPPQNIPSKLKGECVGLAEKSYKCLEENGGQHANCEGNITV